jgi:hypothetical protein
MPGPAPKRSETRRRTNEPAIPIVKTPGAAASQPPLAIVKCHPLAAALYASLKDSPESKFFTPAAWQRARVASYVLSELLKNAGAKGISSMMYAAIQSDWKALLIDPAEQRRLGIEVQAASSEVDPNATRALATVTSLESRLSG